MLVSLVAGRRTPLHVAVCEYTEGPLSWLKRALLFIFVWATVEVAGLRQKAPSVK